MAIKNLQSIFDLVGNPGEAGGPVNNMETQTGPAFPIVDEMLNRATNPSVPANSHLHAGQAEDQAGRSLVGPAYNYQYGGAAATVNPSNQDLNGITPSQYLNNLPD